ncbi:MAG: VIT1/CCC1 transporter family protein [archaeon]
MMLGKILSEWKEFWEIAEIGGIARRYFAINLFDEILTIIGILIASFFSNVTDLKVVALAVIGASIAMTVSGVWGAYLTEMAERKGKIRRLEKRMSISLDRSPIARAHKFASVFLGLVDGVLPMIAAPLMIFPLFLAIPVNTAYYISFATSFFLLFVTGAYLGKISKENLFVSGIRMLFVGLLCAVLIYIVELIIK